MAHNLGLCFAFLSPRLFLRDAICDAIVFAINVCYLKSMNNVKETFERIFARVVLDATDAMSPMNESLCYFISH